MPIDLTGNDYAPEQAMSSHKDSPSSALPGESTTSKDAKDTTRASSCLELSLAITECKLTVQQRT